MKLCRFNDSRIGVIQGDSVIDLTHALGETDTRSPQAMLRLIADFPALHDRIERAAASGERLSFDDCTLLAPVPTPTKLVAAPLNYDRHRREMGLPDTSIEDLGMFLKAPSSIIGPGDIVQLPFPDRRTDHECELALVIGKEASRVSRKDAMDYIFGYTCLIDVTVRGKEDRSTRKSFDTFTPIGPYIVTKDEVPDPNNLDMRLWVNDELRQDANTNDLIFDVQRLIEFTSNIMTLYPGDIIATGTPEGVGPIRHGDTVTIEIERLGRMSVSVRLRD